MRCSPALLLCFGLLSLWSCTNSSDEPFPEEIMGLAPVYTTDEWDKIVRTDARPVDRLGKFYYKTPYIFVSESYQGIHIIDNTDPYRPERVGFIQIYGQTDMAIRGNMLYANNNNDLVTIDISDLENIQVVSRVPNAFPQVNAQFPEDYAGHFECVDPERGTVIGWEEKMLVRPKCWR